MGITKSWHIEIENSNYYLELKDKERFYILSNLEDPTYLIKIPYNDLYTLSKDLQNITGIKVNKKKSITDLSKLTQNEKDMFQSLRTWRNKISEKNNVPAYVVANNQSLIELVKLKELSELSFLNINGLGKTKFQLYYKQIKNIFDNHKKSI